MKFTLEPGALADAAAWVARRLPARPTLPILAGMRLEATPDHIEVSAYDYDVSARATAPATLVHEPGTVLVPGRLFAELAARLPDQPADVVADPNQLTITCGKTHFTLHTLPIEDYPTLPAMPPPVGTVDGAAFATAVKQTALAASRDDAMAALCGVRLHFGPRSLAMTATDRYRLALRELPWQPASNAETAPPVLVPARVLTDAAKSLKAPRVDVCLTRTDDGNPSMLGLAAGDRQVTTRLLDDPGTDFRGHFDFDAEGTARVEVAALVEAAKRLMVVADKATPLRLTFTPGQLQVAADAGVAATGTETLDAEVTGEDRTVALNPHFLLDALAGIDAPTAELAFAPSDKGRRVLITPTGTSPEPGTTHQHVVMPVRLAG